MYPAHTPVDQRDATFPRTSRPRFPFPPANLRAPLLPFHAHRFGNHPKPITRARQRLPSSRCIENAPACEIRSSTQAQFRRSVYDTALRHIGTDCCGDGVLRPVYDKAVYHALWHSFRDGSGRSSARILGGDKACSHCKVCSLLWWFQRKQPDAVSGFATHVRNEYESTPWALCRCYPGMRSPHESGLLTASQCRIARFHKTSYHAAHRHGR